MTDRRSESGLRSLKIQTGINAYAEGSALVRMGNTHVLCTASVEEQVPPWLEGKNMGWITAEYGMLPRSTHTRNQRERKKLSGRTMEIQRLIGRGLRPMVDLRKLGERTIHVDCDVLQADGGTRTAALNGACVALSLAVIQLINQEQIENTALKCLVSAISVGLKNSEILVDLDYQMDSSCDVDMNFVFTSDSELVEIQGTAEGTPMPLAILPDLTQSALDACNEIQDIQLHALQESGFNFKNA